MTPAPRPLFALRPHITATQIPDGMVLLDQRTGRYWQMNATAATVLRALLDGDTREEAAARLTERHPGAADSAHADVDALVSQLHEADLVIAAGPPAPDPPPPACAYGRARR